MCVGVCGVCFGFLNPICICAVTYGCVFMALELWISKQKSETTSERATLFLI